MWHGHSLKTGVHLAVKQHVVNYTGLLKILCFALQDKNLDNSYVLQSHTYNTLAYPK